MQQYDEGPYLFNGTFQIIFPDERNLCTLASLELSLYRGGQHVWPAQQDADQVVCQHPMGMDF